MKSWHIIPADEVIVGDMLIDVMGARYRVERIERTPRRLYFFLEGHEPIPVYRNVELRVDRKVFQQNRL